MENSYLLHLSIFISLFWFDSKKDIIHVLHGINELYDGRKL